MRDRGRMSRYCLTPGCCAPAGLIHNCELDKMVFPPQDPFSVWILAAKNLEGDSIVFRSAFYNSREEAKTALEDLPYRTAVTLKIVQLVPKE